MLLLIQYNYNTMESIDQTTTTDVCESSTVQPVQVNENEVDGINESFDALYAQVETFVKDLKCFEF